MIKVTADCIATRRPGGFVEIVAGADTAKALAIGYALLMLTAYENGECGADKLRSAILFAQSCGLPPEAKML